MELNKLLLYLWIILSLSIYNKTESKSYQCKTLDNANIFWKNKCHKKTVIHNLIITNQIKLILTKCYVKNNETEIINDICIYHINKI